MAYRFLQNAYMMYALFVVACDNSMWLIAKIVIVISTNFVPCMACGYKVPISSAH